MALYEEDLLKSGGKPGALKVAIYPRTYSEAGLEGPICCCKWKRRSWGLAGRIDGRWKEYYSWASPHTVHRQAVIRGPMSRGERGCSAPSTRAQVTANMMSKPVAPALAQHLASSLCPLHWEDWKEIKRREATERQWRWSRLGRSFQSAASQHPIFYGDSISRRCNVQDRDWIKNTVHML